MTDFIVHTSEHFSPLLQGFRRQAGLTQAEMAKRLGVTQQTLSAFERGAENASVGRVLEYLSILGVDLVLRQSQNERPADSAPEFEW
jgi:HTH-type transcriptional regulator/antitoxin HipB